MLAHEREGEGGRCIAGTFVRRVRRRANPRGITGALLPTRHTGSPKASADFTESVDVAPLMVMKSVGRYGILLHSLLCARLPVCPLRGHTGVEHSLECGSGLRARILH